MKGKKKRRKKEKEKENNCERSDGDHRTSSSKESSDPAPLSDRTMLLYFTAVLFTILDSSEALPLTFLRPVIVNGLRFARR